ncbi:MAG: alpha/beta hydrolase [Betaproteobacteria bacterium]|nr:alpha/beta hydrolase [Betaproteobacteria bacterium]
MKSLLFITVASYAGFCLLLYLAQNKLIFFTQPAHVGEMLLPPGYTSEPVTFQSHDGLALKGTLIRPAGGPAPLVIYYGGNAEEISYLAQLADRYAGAALLLVNYRGYGGNPGAPSAAALIADAKRIFDQARLLANIRKDEIYVHGRSLGSGVAVAVASERPVRGVMLTTAFDSLTAVAQAHYPVVPVSLLLRHKFDSVAAARSANIRSLHLVAGSDTIIPPRHARALFDAWAGPKTWREYSQAGHNDIQDTPGYWDTIAAFLKSPPSAP